MFDDLIAANEVYRAEFHDSEVTGRAAKGLAVVTCIDSRIDPLAMLGLRPGDAKIIRNAGARVTDDALRSLILATNLLDVHRVCVVQHTDCAMADSTEASMQAKVGAARGVDASGWQFLAMEDQHATLRADIERIRGCALIAEGTDVGAFVFDVHSGALVPID